MKGFFGPGGECFLYHDVAVEHQECNIITNWLSVADENEADFPLWPAALICLGRTFVVPGGLVQEQIKRELKKKKKNKPVLLPPKKSMVYSYV